MLRNISYIAIVDISSYNLGFSCVSWTGMVICESLGAENGRYVLARGVAVRSYLTYKGVRSRFMDSGNL